MLLFGRHAAKLTEFVRKVRLKFTMKDLGPARHILGMKISRNRDRQQLFLSQTDYIGHFLDRFNMQSAKSDFTLLPINLRPVHTVPTSYLPPPNRMSGSLVEKAEDEWGAGSK